MIRLDGDDAGVIECPSCGNAYTHVVSTTSACISPGTPQVFVLCECEACDKYYAIQIYSRKGECNIVIAPDYRPDFGEPGVVP